MRRVLLLAGLLFAALPAGSVLADTTIGHVGGTGECGQAAFADANYVVPSAGTITSFSFLSTPVNKDQRLDFLALQPSGAGQYTVIGKTGLITLAGTGLETFPANFAVQGGDILGMWVPRQAGVSPNLQNCAHFSRTDTVLQNFDQTSDPGVGDTVLLPNPVRADLNESASLATGVRGPPPPTNKHQCERDGWKNFPQFKNQGQCVRFVETGK